MTNTSIEHNASVECNYGANCTKGETNINNATHWGWINPAMMGPEASPMGRCEIIHTMVWVLKFVLKWMKNNLIHYYKLMT